MNAKLGHTDVTPSTYGESSNRNGTMLIEFMRERDLIAINTRYQKRKGKLWTFEYPNGEKAQLDYIMINKKWRNSAVGSDHRAVTAKIRVYESVKQLKRRYNMTGANYLRRMI